MVLSRLTLAQSTKGGEAVVAEAKKRKLDYRSVSRGTLDYTDFRTLLGALKQEKPDFVVNAAGFTGKPNVDACENQKDCCHATATHGRHHDELQHLPLA